MIRTPGFILASARGADQVAGLGRERGVQRDVVAPAPEVVERGDALDPELGGLLGREERVEPDAPSCRSPGPAWRRPGRPGPGRRSPSVLPSSWVPVNLLRSHLPGLEAVVGLGHVPRQGEHQRHGVLGGRDRVAARRVHDHDPLAGRGRDVDVVDPHARADDRLEPGLVLAGPRPSVACPTGSRSRRPRPARLGARGPWSSFVSTTTSRPGSARSSSRPSSASLSVTSTRCATIRRAPR